MTAAEGGRLGSRTGYGWLYVRFNLPVDRRKMDFRMVRVEQAGQQRQRDQWNENQRDERG